MDKWLFFWKWKLTSHLQHRENKNMSGSADAWLFEGGKKTWVSALFFITYLQVKGYSSCHTIVDKVWIQKVACCYNSSFEQKYEWEWLPIHVRCLFEDKKFCLVTGQRLHSTKQKLDTYNIGRFIIWYFTFESQQHSVLWICGSPWWANWSS